MLAEIKSLFFIKNLFTYVIERKKIDIVKYNKSIQNIINININNYKYFSGKYIIYKDNKNAKEYNGFNNDLIYEGEYSNGKRNGKGQERYRHGKDGIYILYGEYLNGKRHGKGYGYQLGDYLRCEGDYLNGKKINEKWSYLSSVFGELKNGNGYYKEFDFEGNFVFEGEYLNGERNGKGKESQRGNIIYEGEYLNGKRHGKGKEFFYNGNVMFEGEYINGNRWTGKGYDYFDKNKIYELKNGKGYMKIYDYKKKVSYEGEYINGERNGKGKDYDEKDKLEYDGEFLNGKRHGKGKEYDNNNNGELLFEGEYFYGYRLKGKKYTKGILQFEGEYEFNNKWNGKGFDEDGNNIYELKNGNGKVIECDYSVYNCMKFEGEYLNGKRWNGKLKEIDEDGKVLMEFEFKNGEVTKNIKWNF